jgi:Protein of unknown function (DUF1015)
MLEWIILIDFAALGIQVPEILLPNKQIDLAKWAVVACDQYTSEPEYWEKVSALVGESPSTFNLIYPEVYLGKGDGTKRIKNIHRMMREYLQNNLLVSQAPGFIFIDRQTAHASSRKGLIVALDLECYDYQKGSQTLIRATEGTVLERIPPRVKIRAEAPIELPHIMVLIDDPQQLVIEPLAANLARLTKVYQTDFMMNGGHVTGYHVNAHQLLNNIASGLQSLANTDSYHQKYGVPSGKALLYAVGDGNHSLATAKAVWERIKQNDKTAILVNHPARYALVELVNIHDPGIQFEPIHRVVFQVTLDEMFNAMSNFYQQLGCGFTYQYYPDYQELLAVLPNLRHQNQAAHIIEFVTTKGRGIIKIQKPLQNLAVGTLQAFLDDYCVNNRKVEIDYIHGDEVVTELGSKFGNIGFYLPPMAKNALFKTVITDGVLPRKTFSMGEAEEKRYYMECRKIS